MGISHAGSQVIPTGIAGYISLNKNNNIRIVLCHQRCPSQFHSSVRLLFDVYCVDLSDLSSLWGSILGREV